MKLRGRTLFGSGIISLGVVALMTPGFIALAQETSSTVQAVAEPVAVRVDPDQTDIDPNIKDEVDRIQQDVRVKQESVRVLNGLIAQYENRLEQQTTAGVTLKAQLELLDQGIQLKTLEQQRAQEELDRLRLEQERLTIQLESTDATLTLRRALLEETLANMARQDDASPLLSLLGEGSLSAYVSRRGEWRSLQRDLTEATVSVSDAKKRLEAQKEETRLALIAEQAQQDAVRSAKEDLEEEREAKTSLVAQTQNREDEYQRILNDLRRTQQDESDDMYALRTRLQGTIESSDETLAEGNVLLDWPFELKRGISAHFHDRTYPFRNLFEHPGVDLPTPVGTPIHAAAGGYVAWNRTGKQYGNYVMIIHPSGIATVYAHLSAFAVRPDTYVDRGDIIGYSGGRPGDPGAGLSTGPHLHFEVRQDGIPVNPEPFLPERL